MSLIYNRLRYLLLILIAVTATQAVQAQDISISLGPDEIGENQSWTITITASNERLKSYGDFPMINGFKMRGTSSSQRTDIVNGQISSSQSITMTYAPTGQGTYTVKPFEIKINDQMYSSPGKTVKVGPPVEQRRSNDPFKNFFNDDPNDNFFGRRNEEAEFIEVKDDAFLAVSTDKTEAFVGEGITTTLAFYISDKNRARLQFHELGKQLSDILKKIRPENAWEENFNIENISGEPVSIQGKNYTQYKVYQGVFYPLNAEDIDFPSVGLEMIKYKEAKNPTFFGQNRKEDFKTYYTKPKRVKVKELPPHPLKDQVAVGDYLLDERISNNNLETGQSFSYQFNIYGEGNISSINNPGIENDDNFDFYDPNVAQNINRKNNHVTGSKSFSYFGIPKEPGEYPLSNYFEWIFFNPKTSKYDTLRSNQVVRVSGESKKNESIQSTDLGSFYDKMGSLDNNLRSTETFEWMKIVTNIFILAMLGFTSVIMVRGSFKGGLKEFNLRESFTPAKNKEKKTPRRLPGGRKVLVPEEEMPLWKLILQSSLIIPLFVAVALAIIVIPFAFLSNVIIFLILIYIGIHIIIFRLSVYIHKREGFVTASQMYLRCFLIVFLGYFLSKFTIDLIDPELNPEMRSFFSGDSLWVYLILAYTVHYYVTADSLFYYFYKNNSSIWNSFIPIVSFQIMGRFAGYNMPWWRVLIPWPYFKLMRKIAEYQGKDRIIGYLSAVLPFIFFPFLLYDKKDQD